MTITLSVGQGQLKAAVNPATLRSLSYQLSWTFSSSRARQTAAIKCQNKWRCYPWTHISEARQSSETCAASHTLTTINTQSFLQAYSHQTSISTFLRRSLFGRLRPTHPHNSTINLFFSCWGGGSPGRGKWNWQNGWHETRWSGIKGEEKGREGNMRCNRTSTTRLYLNTESRYSVAAFRLWDIQFKHVKTPRVPR